MHAVRKLSVWYKIPIWFQNIVYPKTKDTFLDLQQVFMLALVVSCVNIREFLKDTTTADSHTNVVSKSEFTCFQSLSWLFQLAFFCQIQPNSSGAEFLSTISKFINRMNFVITCLRHSQNVKLGIFTGSRAVDGKEMFKKAWCTCKVVVLPYQAIAYLTFSSPPHLKLPIVYDMLRWLKNRICSCW